MEQQKEYMVCVKCMTYNHAPYITDAMNGFAIQETTFPYVCVIVDDASTDEEQDVITKYLQDNFDLEDKSIVRHEETDDYVMTYTRHKTNNNCYFAVYFLKYNHYSIKKPKLPYYEEWTKAKYIALCEGDDYWTDGKKLLNQVSFLEAHPMHSMCIHAYRQDLYTENGIIRKDIYKYTHDVDIIPDKDVLNGTGMFGATASILYKYSCIIDYPDWAKRAPVGDRPLKLVLFARGHIAYINKVMSVYRVGVPGSWTIRVNRNRNANKQTRRRFIQIMIDFDEWTDQKYHVLTHKAIVDYKKACRKNNIMYMIKSILAFFIRRKK